MSKTTLEQPVKRGAETIAEVTLRKPNSGELRGMKLTNLLQMDVGSMITLLPRITNPALTPDEVAELDPADLMALAGEVVGFFMTAQARAEMEAEMRR